MGRKPRKKIGGILHTMYCGLSEFKIRISRLECHLATFPRKSCGKSPYLPESKDLGALGEQHLLDRAV